MSDKARPPLPPGWHYRGSEHPEQPPEGSQDPEHPEHPEHPEQPPEGSQDPEHPEQTEHPEHAGQTGVDFAARCIPGEAGGLPQHLPHRTYPQQQHPPYPQQHQEHPQYQAPPERPRVPGSDCPRCRPGDQHSPWALVAGGLSALIPLVYLVGAVVGYLAHIA